MCEFSIKCFLRNKYCWQFFIFLMKIILKLSYYSLLTIVLRILVNMTQGNILVSNHEKAGKLCTKFIRRWIEQVPKFLQYKLDHEKAGKFCTEFIRRWIEQVPKFLQYKLASDDNQPVWACPWKSKVHKRQKMLLWKVAM